jgi:hypothetical protein
LIRFNRLISFWPFRSNVYSLVYLKLSLLDTDQLLLLPLLITRIPVSHGSLFPTDLQASSPPSINLKEKSRNHCCGSKISKLLTPLLFPFCLLPGYRLPGQEMSLHTRHDSIVHHTEIIGNKKRLHPHLPPLHDPAKHS